MRLLPPTIFFSLILVIGFCFCLCRAIDCGGNHIATTIIVDQQGKGAFTTIQAAINSIQNNNAQWIKIQINHGKYVEKVEIPFEKPCIILKGSSSKSTIVTYGDNRGTTTLTSSPPNVILSDIMFENTYAYQLKGPAMAASIYGDKSAIFNCGFLGYQDTLFDASGRHYYKDCYFQGEVDFIYGAGPSYYEDCVMNATQGESQPPGFITAQYRKSEDDPSGFVFRRGQVVGIGKVDLGRAWGPYSRVIFWETFLSSVVLPEGWYAWHFQGKENQLTYAEVNCSGPGAKTDLRVPWEKKLEDINLNEYSLSSFINQDNWLANMPAL